MRSFAQAICNGFVLVSIRCFDVSWRVHGPPDEKISDGSRLPMKFDSFLGRWIQENDPSD